METNTKNYTRIRQKHIGSKKYQDNQKHLLEKTKI